MQVVPLNSACVCVCVCVYACVYYICIYPHAYILIGGVGRQKQGKKTRVMSLTTTTLLLLYYYFTQAVRMHASDSAEFSFETSDPHLRHSLMSNGVSLYITVTLLLLYYITTTLLLL